MSRTIQTSRRQFLATAGAALAAGLHHRSTAAAQRTAEADHFESLIGRSFTLSGEESRGVLVLMGVRRHVLSRDDARPAHCRREPFSLHFRARGHVQTGDGRQRLEHPGLNALTTRLHPVGPHGSDYEIHFN